MEPFDPQDPLTKLLAQARRIEARSNFTQNVVRAARQTPQDRGWLAALRAWWEESSTPVGKWAFAGGITAAIVLTVAVLQMRPEASAPQMAQNSPAPAPVVMPFEDSTALTALAASVPVMPALPAAESAWESSYQTEALLAVEDTSQFTDSEIGFLLAY